MRRAVLISILTLMGLFSFIVPALHAGEEAKIIYTKGNVRVQEAGTDFWILAKKDMPLEDKDTIKTAVASEADISLDGTLKNIIRIQQNTELTVEDLKTKKLLMTKGKVLAVMESLSEGSSFEVRTPTAVAGVTGSGMSVASNGNETTVGCFENKAYVRGIDVNGQPMLEIVMIEEGYKRIACRFEMPSDLVALTMLERQEWTEFRQNLKEHLEWLREERAQGSRGAAIALREIEGVRKRFEDNTQDNKDNIFEEGQEERRDEAERGSGSGSESGRYITR